MKETYFNYDNMAWNKIRSIKKIDYNGFKYIICINTWVWM